jgi:TonB-linked SusC/RagA family outer membrane protein
MRKIALLLAIVCTFAWQAVNAQSKQITGQVTSAEDGLGIPGASVVVKGTTIGTTTDIDGNFAIKVEPSNVLVISFVGMVTQEVTVGNQSVVKVVMETESIGMDEVVVTALGITREKKALGYSVQDVKGDALNQTKENNIVNTLSGKVAGVQISGNSGNMGGSARILIRGANSITGNNQPLFVVDGIPFDNGNFNSTSTARGGGGYDYGNMAADINPDDIESVSVLKGGTAAALYGSRASNGVIMITTKKGKKKKGIGVSVKSGINIEQVALLPELQTEYGGGSGITKQVIDGTEYNIIDYSLDETWGPKYDPNLMVLHWDAFDPEFANDYLKPRPWVAPKNDVEDFFETGVTYTNSVALTGGNEESRFRMSYTNSTTDGYMPNSSLDKNTINFSGSSDLNEKLSAEANFNFVNTKAEGRPSTGYDDNNVMQKFVQWGQRQLDMERLKNYKNSDGSQRTWNRKAWNDPTPNYSDNPYWTRYENAQNDERNRFFGNVGLSYKLTDDLVVKGKVYGDYYTFRVAEKVAVGSQAKSSYYEDMREFSEFNYELLVSYNKQLTEDLSLSVNVGGNRMKQTYRRNYGETSGGLVVPGLYNLKNSKEKPSTYDYDREKAINSVYGSFSLGYKNMLYLDGTARNDWSSTLPDGNNSYFYPSVTTSFLFSELPALKESSWLSFGKIRVGWAQVGSDTDPYSLQETYYTDPTNSSFGNSPVYSVPSTQANTDLKPEKTYSWEVGTELSFFNNRLGIDFTYYDMKTEDLITSIAVSAGSGYLYKTINAGSMTNKGVEVALKLTPVRTANFEWNATLNYSKNKNELVELYEGVDNYKLASVPFGGSVNALVGSTYGAIMGTNFVYDDKGNKVLDSKGRYVKTQQEEVLGSVMPDYNLGIHNSFRFKNFDLGFLIDVQQGGKYISIAHMWGMYSGMLEGTTANGIREDGILLDGVIGDVTFNADGSYEVTNTRENDQTISAMRYGADHYYRPKAQNVFDASYIKLREVTLGYTVPQRFTGPIQNLRVSVYGKNLGIWGLDNPGIDPESTTTSSGNVQGIDGGALPTLRNYGFNVSFKF